MEAIATAEEIAVNVLLNEWGLHIHEYLDTVPMQLISGNNGGYYLTCYYCPDNYVRGVLFDIDGQNAYAVYDNGGYGYDSVEDCIRGALYILSSDLTDEDIAAIA